MPYTNIWLTPEQHKIASAYAKETKDSLAGVIRKALSEYLEITPEQKPVPEYNTESAETVVVNEPLPVQDTKFFDWQKERMEKEEVTMTEAVNEPDPYKQRSLLDRLFKKDK